MAWAKDPSLAPVRYLQQPHDATLQWMNTTEVVTTSSSAEDSSDPRHGDLAPLEELIRQTPGAHPIKSMDELRSDAFEIDEELDEFLAFVTESRRWSR